jgi:hypothetical protein
VDKNIDDSSLAWEFLYLVVYWNVDILPIAKARGF